MIRATLKSLLARKLRLVLSGLAVVLAVMFIAGSFVLTDTLGRSFDNLFKTVYENVDLQVSGKPTIDSDSGFAAPVNIAVATVDRVRAVPGVSSAVGQVAVNGARVVGRNGKLLPNPSGTRLGVNWTGEDDVVKLRTGAGPRSDGEVAINGQVAKDGDFKVGDQIEIITPVEATKRSFRVSGIITYSGGRDSIGGEHLVAFTEPVAQRLMLGDTDHLSLVDVKIAQGTDVATVQAALRSALGGDFLVETGDELAKKSAQPIKTIFGYFNRILLGFGAVALLVGVFLILNTFSIIVAQRTRELALMRAMGAGRLQVVGSVLTEALVIGLIGSSLGFLAGIGLGAVGAWGLNQLGGGVETAGLGVPAAAFLLSFGVGILVTLLAALMPALKASRIPPVAAMREAAAADRPLTGLTIGGGVVTAAGVALLGFGLAGQGDATLPLILSGVLFSLVGVALLTPIVCRPVVSLLGRIFSWSVPGKLGRRNSSRNPRRTAITAAAVMIGIALVTGISTVFASVSSTATRVIDEQLAADLIIAGDQTSEVPPVIDPDALRQIKALPEVSNAAAVTYEFFAKANGRDAIVFAYDDWAAARRALKLGTGSGDVQTLGPGQVVIDPDTAENAKLKVGDRVDLILPKGSSSYTVAGITTQSGANNGYVIPMADAQRLFRSAAPVQAYLKLRDGASQDAVKRKVDEILLSSPEVTAQTRDEFIANQLFFINFLLGAVQILLLIAIAISILGVINTLVLSVLERTRELGMLRAIGLRRSQTMRMITVESVVISLFGTLLGLGVGAGLGIAVVRALEDQGITDLSLPWVLMAVYLFAALVIGVGAAVIPAVRAARLNVLNAIAYE